MTAAASLGCVVAILFCTAIGQWVFGAFWTLALTMVRLEGARNRRKQRAATHGDPR